MSCDPKTFLIINSASRSSGTITDFTINLSKEIRNATTIKLLECKIPNTLYNVRTGINDQILFSEGGPNLTATLTAGSYGISDLCLEVQNQLIAAGALAYVCTYNANTSRVTISAGAPFSLLLATGTTQANQLLGFAATDVAGAATYTGTLFPQLVRNQYYTIDINEIPANGVDISNRSFTFPVLNTVNLNEYLIHHAETNSYLSICQVPTNITKLSVKLRDANHNIISATELGLDWLFVVEIRQVLEKNIN